MVGHGHAGKTSLVSAMLYTAGATQRLGRVDDGSTTTDYDDEEIARQMSISTGSAVVEWGGTKINILDTPGFSMFVHEAKMDLPVVDAAIVVVDGVAGVEVVTQRVWNYCEEYKTPRLIVVNRMDRDRAGWLLCACFHVFLRGQCFSSGAQFLFLEEPFLKTTKQAPK